MFVGHCRVLMLLDTNILSVTSLMSYHLATANNSPQTAIIMFCLLGMHVSVKDAVASINPHVFGQWGSACLWETLRKQFDGSIYSKLYCRYNTCHYEQINIIVLCQCKWLRRVIAFYRQIQFVAISMAFLFRQWEIWRFKVSCVFIYLCMHMRC